MPNIKKAGVAQGTGIVLAGNIKVVASATLVASATEIAMAQHINATTNHKKWRADLVCRIYRVTPAGTLPLVVPPDSDLVEEIGFQSFQPEEFEKPLVVTFEKVFKVASLAKKVPGKSIFAQFQFSVAAFNTSYLPVVTRAISLKI